MRHEKLLKVARRSAILRKMIFGRPEMSVTTGPGLWQAKKNLTYRGSRYALPVTMRVNCLRTATAGDQNVSFVGSPRYRTSFHLTRHGSNAGSKACFAAGAAGDWLDFILIVPATTAAGAVSIKDGAGSAITIWAGGATTALVSLVPFAVPIKAISAAGAWSVTTGTNVSVLAVGNFS